MSMTAEQLAQKRFLFTATVKHVEGYQTFFVDAESREEAEAGIENGEGQIYEHELEVTYLDDFILDRVTTTDDYGDYPPISEADLVRMEYNAALCELLPGIQYMDPPDGGSVTPLEQVRRMVADYRQRIAELEAISSAAEKLVRCKGRYHSEQNYRTLAALFGVTTPDLPPLESEARAVIPPDAAHVASVLEFIGSFEPEDIDGDTVELRFDIDGLDTGADASITEYAARGASIIRNFLDGIKCEVKGE